MKAKRLEQNLLKINIHLHDRKLTKSIQARESISAKLRLLTREGEEERYQLPLFLCYKIILMIKIHHYDCPL